MEKKLANIGIETNGKVVLIGRNLYVKTEDALVTVLAKFEAHGYDIMHDEGRPDYYVSIYNKVRFIRCRSCGMNIEKSNLYSRDNRCENCGAETYANHDKYRVWDGVEYTEWNPSFPVIEMLSVYTTWNWELMQPSPYLHADIMNALGMNPDKGWYKRSRPNQFGDGARDNIASYIRHFTVLDADEFLRRWRGFRKNVDFIDDFAAFCHPQAVVTDAPNMGNTLNWMVKVYDGQTVTKEEYEASVRGTYDPNLKKLLFPMDEPTDWDEKLELIEADVEKVKRKQWYLVKQEPSSHEAKRIAGELVTVESIDRKTETVSVFTAKIFQNRSGVAIRIPLSDLTERR